MSYILSTQTNAFATGVAYSNVVDISEYMSISVQFSDITYTETGEGTALTATIQLSNNGTDYVDITPTIIGLLYYTTSIPARYMRVKYNEVNGVGTVKMALIAKY